MHSVTTISLVKYRKAGELAALIRARIAEGQCHGLTIDHLSKQFAICDTVLMRAFKKRHGITIHGFIIREKMTVAKQRMLSSGATIRAIAAELGYSELSNFSRDFTRYAGISPMAFRRNNSSTDPMEISLSNQRYLT